MSTSGTEISSPTDFSMKGEGNGERSRERDKVREFKFSGQDEVVCS